MKTETRADRLTEDAAAYREKQKRNKLLTEFDTSDKARIKKSSDEELAKWQTGYPSGSPQAIFAEQLWKYRLARHSAKFAAVIAIIAAIIGAIAGGIIVYSLTCPQKGPQTGSTKQKPQAEKHQDEKPPARQEVQKLQKQPRESLPKVK
ncbi:MAG: hypothetical protein ACYC09_14915 [Bacteroidota bacterium]